MSHFDTFWNRYPKKVNKKGCAKKWKANKLDDQAEKIFRYLDYVQAHDSKWKGGFIPNPETLINQERWNDFEIPKMPRATARASRPVEAEPEREMSRWERYSNKFLFQEIRMRCGIGNQPVLDKAVKAKREVFEQAEKDAAAGDPWDDQDFISIMQKTIKDVLDSRETHRQRA
jgi:hypothetical protein